MQVSSGGADDFRFRLESPATEVTARIIDDEGQVLRSVLMESMEAGEHKVPWNGLGDDGRGITPGVYRVEVIANDASGTAVPTDLRVSGTVTGVSFDELGARLRIGDQQVSPSDVLEIETSAEGGA